MSKVFKLIPICLWLFDEGGASASGAEAASEGQAEGTKQSGFTEELPGRARRAEKNALSNVVYGKTKKTADEETSEEAENKATQNTENKTKTGNKKQAFRELINNEYKAEFQEIFNSRFRENKEMQERLASQDEVLSRLYERYGIMNNDAARLKQAIEDDESLYAQEADNEGLTVEQYKELSKLRRDAVIRTAEDERLRAQREVEASVAELNREAEALREIYPDFDLEEEVQNEEFQSMLRVNVPMKTAYEVLHLNEIKSSVAAAAERNVVNNIRAKGNRPSENGVTAQSGLTFKTDVSKLTSNDRREIARRVENGEDISF